MHTSRRRKLRLLALTVAAPLALVAAARLFNPNAIRAAIDRQGRRLASQFAPKRLDTPPPWATRSDPPLATFAVLADNHYDDSGKLRWAAPTRTRLIKACHFLNQHIKPQWVLLLGDIISREEAPEQLRHVKALLDEHLRAPYHAIAGNHDGPGYEKVFGPSNYSVRRGGIRFVGIGINYWHWDSGWGNYGRMDWLAAQLAAHRAEPTIILTHNPICIPTFLNSGAVCQLVESQPQVIGIFAGHMHVDYQVLQAKPHLGMPMLVRPPYAFKVCRVHADRILIFTYEEGPKGTYRQAPIYQKLDIPEACRPSRPAAAKAGQ